MEGITRRDAIRLGAVGAGVTLAGAALPRAAWGAPTPGLAKWVDQLPVPGALDLRSGGSAAISAASATHQFHRDLPPAPTYGYGGASYLGPTILASSNVPVSLTAANNLGPHPLAGSIDPALHGAFNSDRTLPRMSLHLHGGVTRPEFDGHPEDTFTPGTAKTYQYGLTQEAANVWYHDHALGITRLNVYAGLAGGLLIRDQWDTGGANPWGLPTGPYELPLILQDKTFNADGSMFYDPAPWVPEFFGDTPVVNGKAYPFLPVDRSLYRFRVYNGCSARVFKLSLSPNTRWWQIGTDLGLLDAPVPLNDLLLTPGERADVLIDFSALRAGGTVMLRNSAVTPYPSGPRARRRGGLPVPEIMQFRGTGAAGAHLDVPVPARLRGGAGQPPALPAVVPNVPKRVLSLTEMMDPTTGAVLMGLLNNLLWETTDIETPRQGTTEVWEIVNTTADTHPIHLHLQGFRLLNRQRFDLRKMLAVTGAIPMNHARYTPDPTPYLSGPLLAPAPNERGWKDTVQANPGEVTRIAVPFGTTASYGFDPDAPYVSPGGTPLRGYVWHCHILDHEDNEMMLPYRVVP